MRKRNAGWNEAGIAVLACMAGVVGAAPVWWDGPAASWNNAASWSSARTATTPNPDVVPGNGDTATFSIDGYSSTTRRWCTLDASQSVDGLVFRNVGTGGVGLKSGTLTLGAGGITMEVGANVDMLGDVAGGAFTLVLGADQVWRNPTTRRIILASGSGATAASDINLAGRTLFLGGVAGPGSEALQLSDQSPNGRIVDSVGGANLVLYAQGGLELYNWSTGINSDRVADGIAITSYGGRINNQQHSTTPANLSETVGPLTLAKGTHAHHQRQIGTGYTKVFTYGGLSRTAATAAIRFDGTWVDGSGPNLGITTDARNRVLITGQPTTSMLGGWATCMGTGMYGFAAYSTDVYAGFERGVYATLGSSLAVNTSDANGIYNFTSVSRVATANLLVRALGVESSNDRSVTLNAYSLTIASGGLFFSGTGAFTLSATSGFVTVGQTAGNHYLFATDHAVKAKLNTIDAVIANNAAGGTVGLVKSGVGTLTLTKANTYTGDTVVNEGTVDLSTAGSIASSPNIEVLYGGTLSVSNQTATWTLATGQKLLGSGRVVGNVNLAGTVAPGAGAGTLTVTGNVAFASGATVEVEAKNALLGGDKWAPGYDRLEVLGTVALGSGVTLDVKVLPGEALAVGEMLFVIDNDGSDAVTGALKSPAGAVLAQGDTFAAGGKGFQVSYRGDLATGVFDAGSGGNDVVLKVVAPPSLSGTVIVLR